MYGIEIKPARLAYKIGHVDASKLQPGDFLEAWSEDEGRGYRGRLFDLRRTPPTSYRVELYIPSHIAERLEILLSCTKCLKPPSCYGFFKFHDGQIGLSSGRSEEGCECSCRHELLTGEAKELFEKHASWGRIP